MIAIDTNILVYAHRGEAPFHKEASARMREVAEGGAPWGIPSACLHEFLAVVTNPRVFTPPSSIAQAIDQVNAWLASPQAQVLHTGSHHWTTLSDLSKRGRLSGGQIHDARIAAICIENAVSVLWTADRDFSRFRGLKTANPLLG